MLNKVSNKPSGTTETDAFLSPDTLAGMRDVLATKPIPHFAQPLEYAFEIEGNAAPEIQTIAAAHGRSSRTRVIVKSRGVLREVGPVAKGEVISTQELSKSAREIAAPAALRPEWLDLVYFPKTMPARIEDRFAPGTRLHTRVSEQMTREWPWNTVGKLIITRPSLPGIEQIGSGVMVGPNLMLTASHAMPWGTSDSTIRFFPAYRDAADPRFGFAYVAQWRGVRTGEGNPNGLDYVICQLDWRIGDRTGWMGSQHSTDDDFYEDRSWTSVGYPKSFLGGERPAVELGVGVRDVDNEGDNGREIETVPFTSGGWSGGPLWGFIDGEPRVVAVNSGNEKDGLDPRRDVHAGGRHLVDLIKYGYANWT